MGGLFTTAAIFPFFPFPSQFHALFNFYCYTWLLLLCDACPLAEPFLHTHSLLSRRHVCCVYECCRDRFISALCLSPGCRRKYWSFVCRPTPMELGPRSPGKLGLFTRFRGPAPAGNPMKCTLCVPSQVLIKQSAIGSGFLFYDLEPDASFEKEKSLLLLNLSQQSSENRKMSWLALLCELQERRPDRWCFHFP